MKLYFILAAMLLATAGSAQADTFRWVDKSGKVHYGDVPAEEAAQVEQKKFGVAPEAEDANLPYATRLARQNFPVTLYVFTDCGTPCQQGRDFLKMRGIPFTEKNLVTQEDMDAFKRKSGIETAPALGVGKDWLKGFEAGQWNSELDIAGYPQSAPYRPKASPATPPNNPAVKN